MGFRVGEAIQAAQAGAEVALVDSHTQEVRRGVARRIDRGSVFDADVRDMHLVVNDGICDLYLPISSIVDTDNFEFLVLGGA